MAMGSCFAAHIVRDNRGVHRIGGQRDGNNQVGLRQPVPAEIAGVNNARHLLTARNAVSLHVIGLRLQNQPVHGVPFGGGQLADIVGWQGNRVALPRRGQRLAVRG